MNAMQGILGSEPRQVHNSSKKDLQINLILVEKGDFFLVAQKKHHLKLAQRGRQDGGRIGDLVSSGPLNLAS